MTFVGLQLYTVRDECDRDLAETLRRLGAQGYDGVELYDLHGHEPGTVRAWLDDVGSRRRGPPRAARGARGRLPALADELAVLGTDRSRSAGSIPTRSTTRQPSRGGRVGRASRATDAGLELGFHNHWSELRPLEDGRTFLDLLRDLPAHLLWLELDLGWIWHAGADPVSELERTTGRCPLVHVKDYASREGRDDVPVGDGIVGYERVLPAAVSGGRRMAHRRAGRGRRRSVHGGRTLAAGRAPNRGGMTAPARVGVVGCGIIAARYVEDSTGVRALAAGRVRRPRSRVDREFRGAARLATARRRRAARRSRSRARAQPHPAEGAWGRRPRRARGR